MKNRQQGTAIVEFALILPFLLLLTFLTTEFGRAIWQYNVLTKSARDAARYLSIQTPDTHVTEARNLMVYGNTAGDTGSGPLALGLSLSNVPAATCCTWRTEGTLPVIKVVTVRISGYTFRSMFNSVLGLPFGQVTYSDITATMRAAL